MFKVRCSRTEPCLALNFPAMGCGKSNLITWHSVRCSIYRFINIGATLICITEIRSENCGTEGFKVLESMYRNIMIIGLVAVSVAIFEWVQGNPAPSYYFSPSILAAVSIPMRSLFEYPVTRPVTVPYFPTVVLLLGTLWITLVTLINLVAVGYEYVSTVSTSFNSTNPLWYDRFVPSSSRPSFALDSRKCDGSLIKLNEGYARIFRLDW